jgi:FixJ family two-component response regulator
MSTFFPVVHLVDDGESMRTALARLRWATGHEVRTYASAREFLLAPPSSCTLPTTSATRRPRATAKPVIFITAEDNARSRGLATLRLSEYVVEPFTGESLIEAVS